MPDGEITPIYGYWIKGNLRRYIFCSDEAKHLEAEFKEVDLADTSSNSRLIILYQKFIVLFCNSMHNAAFKMSESGIISYDIDAYLVKNEYGIITPIGLLKEQNKEFEYDLDSDMNEARERIKKLESEMHTRFSPNHEDVEKLKAKKHKPSKVISIIGIFISIITICAIYQKRNFILNNFKDGMIWFWLTLGILLLLLTYNVINEIIKVKTWNGFLRDCIVFQNINNNISDIESELIEYYNRLKVAIKEGTDTFHQSNISFNDYSNILNKKINSIEKLLKKPAKLKKGYGIFSLILSIGIMGFIIVGTQEKYYNKLAEYVNQFINYHDKNKASDSGNIYGTDDADMKDDNIKQKVFIGYKKINIQNTSESSYLRLESTGAVYNAVNTCDGNISTCWQDGVEGDGIGEYLEYYFDGIQQVIYFDIYNGNLYSEKKYWDNNRPSVIQVEAYIEGKAVTAIECYLEDVYTTKPVSILIASDYEPITCDKIRIYIVDVYKGNLYKDTCISEIEFYAGDYTTVK